MIEQRRRARLPRVKPLGLGLLAVIVGCFDPALLLNPSFVNTFTGELFPFAPRPENGFVLVRVVNSTTENLTFIVTVERARMLSDETGTVNETDTINAFTTTGNQANESGILFDCFADNPITRIGLGENLNNPDTEAGLLVGGFSDITEGFGVPPNINPLSSANGDFDCGDTVIYEAFESANAPGGFKVQAFVLDWETQPETAVRNTFGVAADFLRGGL
jgi:hypothetical protein